ncbi:MAG TPA: AAA family ATPase [Treponemataceae bacterium]|nr:AAA family ATPase [Treponemataceae bacterium]
MNIALSQEFLTCLSAVPAHIAKKARETISKFRISPTSIGLNYEKLPAMRDKNLRSIRVDQDFRIILWASPEGGNHVFLWLDHHDDAYAWSRNRRVEINPELGALQVYETCDADDADGAGSGTGFADAASSGANPASPAIDESGGLFQDLRDRELMRLGVPEELIPLARSVRTDADLERIEKKLPPLAFQGLFLIAAGYSYEEAVNSFERGEAKETHADDDDLLASPESRATFFLVEDDQILEEMFNAPLEKWRVFLHPSQRRLVEKDWNGAVKVTGGPGTGKTVVAIHRARWLAQKLGPNAQKKILFTTFTKNLAQDIQSLLGCICSTDELNRIDVRNIDSVARDVLRMNRFDQTIMFENSEEVEELWEQALTETATDEFPRAFYREEWEEIIQPQQIRDIEAYKAASRAGRKTRLTRQNLISVWPVFETYLALLREHNWIESQDAFFAASAFLADEKPYASVIVDETQDMGIPALTFLRALTPEGLNDLFLAGDAHQTLYTRKTVLSRAGIQVRGRSRKLLLNYRTTEQIGKWATRLIEGTPVDDLDGSPDTLKGYRSLVSGPEPLDLRSLVPEEKLARVRNILSSLEEHARSSTCIAVPSRDLAQEWKANLSTWGITAAVLEKDTEIPSDGSIVCIATIHRIKGLEFDRVIVRLPQPGMNNSAALGFVAATRARKELVVM